MAVNFNFSINPTVNVFTWQDVGVRVPTTYDVGSSIVAQTSRTAPRPSGRVPSRNELEGLLDDIVNEKKRKAEAAERELARRAGLTPLQRIDEDIADIDSKTTVPTREYLANQERRAGLMKDRAKAEQDEQIRKLADEIIARRSRGRNRTS